MRVIALGTGRPFVRRAQANCSWLIELGNGDKFVMDFGSGSQANFTALEIPHQDVTAYFATHLHADHVGDFAQVWIGSWAGGRVKPLVLYGPSGPEPKYGTEHFVRKQMESLAWDTETRLGLLPDAGAEVEVHEFDFTQDRRGLRPQRRRHQKLSGHSHLRRPGQLPARMERSLLRVFRRHHAEPVLRRQRARAPISLIHECFNTVQAADRALGLSGENARSASAPWRIPRRTKCGKVLALVKPRHAVVYHFFNDFDTAPEIERDDPQALPGSAGAGAGSDGVQRDARTRSATRLAVTPTLVWPNKERHDGVPCGDARKQRRPCRAGSPTSSCFRNSERETPRRSTMRRITRRQASGDGSGWRRLSRRGRGRRAYPERPIRVIIPVHRRRCGREHHAAARRQHGAAARSEARPRGEARRGRQYRHPGSRARRAGRLHDPGRRHQQLRHQPVPASR